MRDSKARLMVNLAFDHPLAQRLGSRCRVNSDGLVQAKAKACETGFIEDSPAHTSSHRGRRTGEGQQSSIPFNFLTSDFGAYFGGVHYAVLDCGQQCVLQIVSCKFAGKGESQLLTPVQT